MDRTIEAEAEALREEWGRLSSDHERLTATGAALGDSRDGQALRAYTEQLRQHSEEVRAFTQALDRFHDLHGRSVGLLRDSRTSSHATTCI